MIDIDVTKFILAELKYNPDFKDPMRQFALDRAFKMMDANRYKEFIKY